MIASAGQVLPEKLLDPSKRVVGAVLGTVSAAFSWGFYISEHHHFLLDRSTLLSVAFGYLLVAQ